MQSKHVAHRALPTLFGQKFMFDPADNRFGLPASYSLHAWIWKHDPSGTFPPFNPQVPGGISDDGATEPTSLQAMDGM